MTNNWQAVWNKRSLAGEIAPDLDTLIRLDGFDSGAGFITAQDWRTSVARNVNLLGIRQEESVFEFGCGAGAFLYALAEQHAIAGGGG